MKNKNVKTKFNNKNSQRRRTKKENSEKLKIKNDFFLIKKITTTIYSGSKK